MAVGFVPWGPEHFVKGDEIRFGGNWHQVTRVNRLTVSVAGAWQPRVQYAAITGRRSNGQQLDSVTGVPYPVPAEGKTAP